MAGSEAAKQIIVGGIQWFPPRTSYRYEKTTSAQEQVCGRIAVAGTTASQAKLSAVNSTTTNIKRPMGVFLKQDAHTPFYSNRPDDSYADDGEPVDIAERGVFEFQGTLISGQSVEKWQPCTATTLGKLTAYVGTGFICAVAIEAVDASSADASGKFLYVGGGLTPALRLYRENVVFTINTTTAVLTHIPIAVVHAESVYAATLATAGLKVLTQDTTPATGEIYVAYTTGVLTLLATDGITNVHMTYWTYGDA